MGNSVWLFMWLLDKVTKIDEYGDGWVLGGKPIKTSELPFSDRTARRYFDTLEAEGYITTVRTPYGRTVKVKKAKKRSARIGLSDGRDRPELAYPDRPQTAYLGTICGRSNKTRQLQDSKDSDFKKVGHPVKIKNMPFNTHSDDYEEGVVDYDGDAKLRDPVAERKAEDKELTARFNELVDWLIKHQGRNPIRTSRPKQIKALKKLLDMRVTGAEAQEIIRQEEATEFWRGKPEKPDYWTVVAVIQKRG